MVPLFLETPYFYSVQNLQTPSHVLGFSSGLRELIFSPGFQGTNGTVGFNRGTRHFWGDIEGFMEVEEILHTPKKIHKHMETPNHPEKYGVFFFLKA